ncbi:histidine phosphatase family protein [Acinetobacter chinensis]|nr:histidine phosphatase family protein [Acinetobacter chinensis]
MMELQIDLLRHGETTLSHTLRGSTDDALTQNGFRQMWQTVDHVWNPSDSCPWQMIFSSNLLRCQSFAEQLQARTQSPLILDAQLQEMHFGDWEGRSTQDIYEQNAELLANFWQQPSMYYPPNAEKYADFQQRVLNAVQDIYQQMQRQHISRALVVTHGGVIKFLKCLALQQPLDDLLKMTAPLGQLCSMQLLLDEQSNQYHFRLLEAHE